MKWIIILVVLAAIVGGGFWYYERGRNSDTEYQVAIVTRGDIVQAVTAAGQLNPVISIQVGSQISGTIKRLYADFNSVVKSNQVIVEIEPSTYQAGLLRAEAELANAKANLNLAQIQANRANALFTNSLISASDHDVTVAQALQAEAAVKSAEAAVTTATVDLSRCTIVAPVDGVVISRNVDVGQTVAASFNTPTLFLIANDLSKMHIHALVSEADIGGVTTGARVNFTVDAFPYRTFHGDVTQIRYGAITNQNVVNYDCVITVNNDDLKLLPGMTANASIVIAEQKNVLRVPNAALRFRPPEAIGHETNAVAESGAGTATGTQPAGGGSFAKGGPNIAAGMGGQGPAGGGAREAPPGGAGPGRKGGGGGDRKGGGGPAGKPRGERSGPRTIYVMDKNNARERVPKPVKVKTGISDGINTEILEGLNEGDEIIVGLAVTQTGSKPTANPFGGGVRRF